MSPETTPTFLAETLALSLGVFLGGATLFVAGLALGVPAAVAFVIAALIALAFPIAGSRAFRRSVVKGPEWQYAGVNLEGEGLALLQDIGARFEYAEGVMDDLPAAMAGVDIREDADTLLWEAAGHAARASEIDRELAGLRYAATGSAASAWREELERTRDERLAALRIIQRRADEVARAAGEAAAAAALARERTGSVYELEMVAPSRAEVSGTRGLDAAKERLRLAAEVWTELDETTAIKRAQLDEERRQQPG
jgi:hypothetical protein